jgi:hypothetical protein
MKCPHCDIGIAEDFKKYSVVSESPIIVERNGSQTLGVNWSLSFQRCPECRESIIYLERVTGGASTSFLAYPTSKSRPVPPEVIDPYKQDFIEACKVLPHSPKASAALSRRCLQMILRDKAASKSKDLFDQIKEVSGKLPSHIADDLDAVRNIGNFAAHPLKSTNTGEIMPVEENEAEWNLDILELLFDFYFVQPAISAKRRTALNIKLKEAGKPELP